MVRVRSLRCIVRYMLYYIRKLRRGEVVDVCSGFLHDGCRIDVFIRSFERLSSSPLKAV